MKLEKLIRWAKDKRVSHHMRRKFARAELLTLHGRVSKPFRCSLPKKQQRKLGLLPQL